MFINLRITLPEDEAQVLARVARAELREPRDQLRWLLQQELQRRGLLNAMQPTKEDERDADDQ